MRVVRFGVFEANLDTGELRKQGVRVKLQDQPFQILALLLERPGQLVAREDLRLKLWPSDTFVDFDHGLNNAINRLREALSDSANSPRFIETLPRRGYRFLGEVEAVGSGEPAQVPTAKQGAPTTPTGGYIRGRWRWRWVAAICLAFGLGSLLVLRFTGLPYRAGASSGGRDLRSLAVLPLENLSGDSAQDYFADGMTDALITDLAQFGTLRVISRRSSMAYKGSRKTLPQIAQELGVEGIIEGSVIVSGGQVRINAQLVEARTDRHIWARPYERALRDVVALQSEVARDIAGAIQVQATPGERGVVTTVRPVDPAAYEAYLRGRILWNRWSVEEARTTLPYFEQALAIDPNYAAAYSGVSDSNRVLALLGGENGRQAWQRAETAAMRALSLDPALAEAHRSLATVRLWYDWDPVGSEREVRRALELNAGDAETYRVYSVLLRTTGRLDEAISNASTAQQLDPLSPLMAVDLGATYYLARQYDRAIEQLEKAKKLDPTFAQAFNWTALCDEAKGNLGDAIVEYKKSVDRSPASVSYLANLGRGYAVSGQRSEARAILSRLTQVSATQYVSPVHIALLYAALGERNQAFAWFEQAYQERDAYLLIASWPWFDALRSDDRFQELMKRVALQTHAS
jgi:TolB-like protein/DNA-binding winged helix-turn-helix (wHTH) protein/Flp pilus assembly protein TadD